MLQSRNYVYAERNKDSVVNLDWNEADQNVTVYENDLINCLSDIKLHMYGEYFPSHIRKLVNDFYGVSYQSILPVPGVDYGIEQVLRVLCENRKEVVCSVLSYKHFEVFARQFNASVKHINNDEIKKMKDYSGILYLVNPNNPTGQLLEIEEMIMIVERNLDAIVIVDEAYIEFSNQESLVCFANKFDNLIVLRTMSKAFGLAGVKYGLIFTSENIASLLYPAINRKCISNIVNYIINIALQRADRLQAYTKEVLETKERCADIIGEKIASEANFFTLLVNSVEKYREIQRKHKIATRSLSETYGVHNGYRLTIPGKKNRELFYNFIQDLKQNNVIKKVENYD